MIERDELLALLKRARKADPDFKLSDPRDSRYNPNLFGAQGHHYELNPPLDESVVREYEADLGIAFPEDYVRFITQVGNGGAGPGYGIEPFEERLKPVEDPKRAVSRKAYCESLTRPFAPRPMLVDEAMESSYTMEAYERAPENFFIYEGVDEENWWWSDGMHYFGTRGCQWDIGLVTEGERRGQVFEIDNEGAFLFLAPDFDTFYQKWVDELSDALREQRPRLFGGIFKKLRK